MSKRTNPVLARFDALQPRERWLVAVAVLGAIVLVGYSLFIDPALQRTRQAERTLADLRAQQASLQAQTVAMQAPERDPEAMARAELGRLKQQLAEQLQRLRAFESALVPPDKVPGLLEEMIGQRSGLRLLSLKTLPAAPFLEPEGGEKAPPGAAPGKTERTAGLFRHGVEIRLEGSYQDLSAYVGRLEKAPVKLLWSSLALSAENHPRLVLTLVVQSLSLDKTWLIV